MSSADHADGSGAITGLRAVNLRAAEPVSSEVARALIDYILAGHVGPGERLPSERQLSEAFGVGRSVVREGIKSLGLLGLIEFRHGGGSYLRASQSDLLPKVIEWGLLLGERHATDLVEARQFLEQELSGLSAERRSTAQLDEMHRSLQAMERATTTDEFVDADVAFHLAVADGSNNSALTSMHRSIQSLLHVWIHRVMDAESSFAKSYSEHVPVLEAIRAGDADTARMAMQRHMQAASARLVATLKQAQH